MMIIEIPDDFLCVDGLQAGKVLLRGTFQVHFVKALNGEALLGNPKILEHEIDAIKLAIVNEIRDRPGAQLYNEVEIKYYSEKEQCYKVLKIIP